MKFFDGRFTVEDMEIIELYILVLAFIAGIPIVLDICLAYWSRHKCRQLLISEASRNKLDLSELQEFIKECTKAPPGISGLARTIMALTVIVILGMAVLHILVRDGQAENMKIVDNILSMLAGLLAAITGFYFGGRAAEKKQDETGNSEMVSKKKPTT